MIAWLIRGISPLTISMTVEFEGEHYTLGPAKWAELAFGARVRPALPDGHSLELGLINYLGRVADYSNAWSSYKGHRQGVIRMDQVEVDLSDQEIVLVRALGKRSAPSSPAEVPAR